MEENDMNKNISVVKDILDFEVPRVENMQSNRGNNIPNQFIIRGNDWVLFQSYNSPIALKKDDVVYIFKDWDYSVTTAKYRREFLGEGKADTLRKLKSGEYIAVGFEVA